MGEIIIGQNIQFSQINGSHLIWISSGFRALQGRIWHEIAAWAYKFHFPSYQRFVNRGGYTKSEIGTRSTFASTCFAALVIIWLGVINLSEKATPASIIIRGYSPTQPVADIEELAGPLNAVNTAKAPNQIQPIQKPWQPRFENGKAEYRFQPHSFTVIKFN